MSSVSGKKPFPKKKSASGLDPPTCAVPGLLLSVKDALEAPSGPNLPSITSCTLKILELVSKHRSERKLIISRATGGVEVLLKCLQVTENYEIIWNVLSIFLTLSKYKHTSRLVAEGVVGVVLVVQSAVMRCPWCSDPLLLLFHSLISRLALRDKRFGVKARLNGMLPITVALLKSCQSNHHQLITVLRTLKVLATNCTNAEYLSKQGCIGVLCKLLLGSGSKDVVIVRHCVDVLSTMLKHKSVASKPNAQGCVKQLLSVYEQLHATDRHNRHLALRKAMLTALKSALCTSSCIKTFSRANGLQILYSSATDMSEGTKELRPLATLSCSILRKCLPKVSIPIASKENPIKFDLPYEVVLSSAPSPKLSSETLASDESIKVESMSSTTSVSNTAMVTSEGSGEPVEAFKEDGDHCNPASDDESSASNSAISEIKEETRKLFRMPSKSQLTGFDKYFPELCHYPAHKPAVEGATQPAMQPCLHPLSDEKGDTEFETSISPMVSNSTSVIVVPTGLQSDATEIIDDASKTQRTGSDSSDPARSVWTAPIASVLKFSEVPAPQSLGHIPPQTPEPLYKNAPKVERKLYLSDVERVLNPKALINKTVFDLDKLISASFCHPHASKSLKKQMHSADDLKTLNSRPAISMLSCARSSPNLLQCVDTDSTQTHKEGSESTVRSVNQSGVESHTEITEQTKKVPVTMGDCEVVSDGNPHPVSTPSDSSVISTSDKGTTHSQLQCEHTHLVFESRFESGNLRKAIQVRPFEYDLILNSDINTDHHHQWFYFKVSGTRAGNRYRFNIINAEKPNSQFNFGMQPVMYSMVEALNGHPGWTRTGNDVSYYRNNMTFEAQPATAATAYSTGSSASAESVSSKGHPHKSYHTLTFAITFQHDNDTCYMAYHYPYTYTLLQEDLRKLEETMDSSQVYYHCQDLCTTLSGNVCPLLTITSQTKDLECSDQGDPQKQYVVLSARVHPGESNSSWIMAGILDYLVSDCSEAKELREKFVFKIVPMLNAGGVINGSHRCSLSGQDLNRQWITPNPLLHPTVYSLKSLLQWLIVHNRRPLVFCDLHGHSRRKNIFMYGCKDRFSTREEEELPRILDSLAPAFSYESCSFQVERSKEATARVIVWRELGVTRAYTMESTYCGADQGPYKGRQLGTQDLKEMGRYFCMALQSLQCKDMSNEPLSSQAASAAIQAAPTVDDPISTSSDSSNTDSEWYTETMY